jgi:hypothetical protein
VIPNTSKAIAFLAQRLFTHVLPEQRSQFGMADVALLGLLFEMVGQDFDRAAQARLEDIREMRAIFADARRRGLEVDPRPDALDLSDVRIARLDEVHAIHGRALIELHARIEQVGDAELDRQVWQYLERHAERHRYDVNF